MQDEKVTEEKMQQKDKELNKKYLSGPHLVKELPLIKLEPYIYAVIVMVSFTFTLFGHTGLIDKTIGATVSLIMLLVPIGVWYWKTTNYLPSKKRSLIMRLYNSRIGFISAEPIPADKRIKMGGDRPSVRVGNPHKHIEGHSGRSLIVAVENRFENIDILADNPIQPETDLLSFMAEEDEYRGRVAILRNQGKFGKLEIPQLLYIVGGLVLIALAVTVWVVFQQQELLVTLSSQIETAEKFVKVN